MQKTITPILSLFFVFLFLNISTISQASHIMGGDFSYVCQGGGAYAINLRLFRDCGGISLGPTQTIILSSPTCGTISTTLTNMGGPVIRTPLCSSAPDVCDPNSTGGLYGIEEYFYRGIVTLPGNCSDWTMSWRSCCRNYGITTLANGANEWMYIDAQLDATICNNSPAFNNDPTFFLCANQENRYSSGAVDTEADSLVYSLVNCKSDVNTSVVYASGYSGTNPLANSMLSIDAYTGEIIIVPTIVQRGVVCLKVEEYRNNVKIGEILRDLQFEVTACATNTLPVLSGIDGTADSTTITGSYSIDVCANDEVKFYIQGFDAEAVPSVQLQNLELEWNYGIQNASFIVDYNLPYPKAEFKWTPNPSDIGTHYFFIAAHDDACPILGSNIYGYKINVLPNLTANITGITSNDTLNATNGETVLLEVGTNNTSPDLIYSWTPTTGLSCTDCPDPVASPNTTTIYTVTVTDPNTNCSTTSEIEVNVFGVSTNNIPKALTSWNVQPNPVLEHSIMNYELNTTSEVSIELYDILGQRVASIINERQPEGRYEYPIGLYLKEKPSGVYFISMQINGQRVSKKLIVR